MYTGPEEPTAVHADGLPGGAAGSCPVLEFRLSCAGDKRKE